MHVLARYHRSAERARSCVACCVVLCGQGGVLCDEGVVWCGVVWCSVVCRTLRAVRSRP